MQFGVIIELIWICKQITWQDVGELVSCLEADEFFEEDNDGVDERFVNMKGEN